LKMCKIHHNNLLVSLKIWIHWKFTALALFLAFMHSQQRLSVFDKSVKAQ
jgi:hypothetical protein